MSDGFASTLVLGLGNLLMGDEGVGVHIVRALEKRRLPEDVECLDGGTGGLMLLAPLEHTQRILMVDAATDGKAPGTITRPVPHFSSEYPPTLTAHDIGIKDLLDALYILGGNRDVVLYTISVNAQQPICLQLSPPVANAAAAVTAMIFDDLAPLLPAAKAHGCACHLPVLR